MRLKCLNFIVFPVLIILISLYSNISFSKDNNYDRVGLSFEERQIFYHLPEGSERYPYLFFLAMEQPTNGLPFYENLERFSFIPDPNNKLRLPIGLTVDDRQDGKGPLVGITCAACHVGEIRYKGKTLRLDGGASMVDFEKFSEDFGDTATWTLNNPDALKRFMQNAVKTCTSLGGKNCAEKTILEGITKYVAIVNKGKQIFDKFFAPEAFGYGRADSFGTARNFVWGPLDLNANLEVANAPLSYPHLWGIEYIQWLHWNGNTTSVMERNIGQALGLGATVNLKPGEDQFKSSIIIKNLHTLENLIYKMVPGIRIFPLKTWGFFFLISM